MTDVNSSKKKCNPREEITHQMKNILMRLSAPRLSIISVSKVQPNYLIFKFVINKFQLKMSTRNVIRLYS